MNEQQIAALNQAIELAIEYGGDYGGAYCLEEYLSPLLEKLREFLDMFDGRYVIQCNKYGEFAIKIIRIK